jgi:uncharacterized iron-regulated membrane protein
MPRSERSAVQILVGRQAEEYRVYINPYSLQVMKIVSEDARFMPRISHLHGELLMGDPGSYMVETAASWAIIMILTGLYLWWPRDVASLGGVVYPRFGKGKRIFWRDIHAVTGVWISGIALLFLLSGLPWAKSWGGYLKAARRLSNKSIVHQDWTTGSSSEKAARMAMNQNSLAESGDEHAAHHAHNSMGVTAVSYAPIDKMIDTVAQLHLAFPVLIAPPMRRDGPWIAKSDAQDRVLRDQVTLDAQTGAVLARFNFNQRPLVDRLVGIGVAAHEGHLFGWLNQLLNLCAALGLIVLCLSAVVLWWRRKPEGALGAPVWAGPIQISALFVAMVTALAVYLPFFGLTLLTVLALERLVLTRIPVVRDWLGLAKTAS